MYPEVFSAAGTWSAGDAAGTQSSFYSIWVLNGRLGAVDAAEHQIMH